MKTTLLPWLCERLGPWMIEGLGSSLSWEVRGGEYLESVRDRAHILVFWHARVLFMAYFFRHRGYHVIASEHTDAELITRAVAPMGIRSLRGSTTRGASKVLLAAARLLRSGGSVGFTPDGPRGPRHVFQAGALVAARLGHSPILPVTASSDRAFVFSSWDRFVLPREGGRAVVEFFPPVPPPHRGADLEIIRRDLEESLAGATDRLDREMGIGVNAG